MQSWFPLRRAVFKSTSKNDWKAMCSGPNLKGEFTLLPLSCQQWLVQERRGVEQRREEHCSVVTDSQTVAPLYYLGNVTSVSSKGSTNMSLNVINEITVKQYYLLFLKRYSLCSEITSEISCSKCITGRFSILPFSEDWLWLYTPQ